MKHREIASSHNPKFKVWKSLLDARGVKEHRAALISGTKITTEFLVRNPDRVQAILLPSDYDGPFAKQTKSFSLTHDLFKTLDVINTKAPILVVDAPEIPQLKAGAPHGLELVLALADPGNLGAVLRSAEAFNVKRVILTAEACSPFLPKAIRASSGASFRIHLEQAGPLAETPLDAAFVLDMKGEDISRFKWPQNLRLILGQEGKGLPSTLASARALRIPMTAGESLNATVAASIALFSFQTVNNSQT